MPEGDLRHDPRSGPFVTALICERILEERDGIKTAVRIIDQLNRAAIGTPPPAIMEPFIHSLSFLVRLKAGIARGTFQINLKIRKPDNQIAHTMSHAVHLSGPEDAGTDLVFNLMMLFDATGTWWFDVYVNDEKWTQTSLRVIYLPRESSMQQLPY